MPHTVRGATFWLLRIASVAWMSVIFAFSSIPGSDVPSRWGSLAHFVEYAVLGALLLVALRDRLDLAPAAAWAVLLSSLYGITDEFHQAFVPGRVPDVSDWGVDTLGAAFGALAVAALVRAIGRRRAVPAASRRS